MTTIPVLVDNRNFDEMLPKIISEMQTAELIGLDTETQDDERHEGLNIFMAVDPKTRKKSTGKKLVFDINRTTMTGFSVHVEGSRFSYYINLAHADVENRVPVSKARQIIDAKPASAAWIIHNAPFELVMFFKCHGIELTDVICTLQMAVSAYGPDEYTLENFNAAGMGGFRKLVGSISKAFRGYTGGRNNMNAEQAELFAQITAKESDADHSYNGFVKAITFGYGLKQAVKSFFGYDMVTFEQVLGDKAHMGQLTGEEVVSYGADDAYWAVRLFRALMQYMLASNPDVLQTFFDQENPMVYIYADLWMGGMRVNFEAIERRRADERHNCAEALRKLKGAVRALLPFPEAPEERLTEYDDWYEKNWRTYRARVAAWAMTDDSPDDFTQCTQASGAVANAWATEVDRKRKLHGPNFTHYMMMRTLIYDLLREKPYLSKGKVQSDGEFRGKLLERVQKNRPDDKAAISVLEAITELAGIEQRMKLYLTPYVYLTDPATGRMYPVVSSKLAARRMASSTPNGMQLAKRGESTYVRGFFLADEDDHVIVSIDWSGIELVEIGDFSGDPEFKKAFGQIPYEDLHAGAAADILAVDLPGLNEEIFNSFKTMPAEEIKAMFAKVLVNLKGEQISDGGKAVKYWRTEIGKGANFNYWYSGWLGTIGDKMGWDMQKTGEATERYRQRFPVAEQWRVGLIHSGQANGYVQLPDNHRRYRFEATPLFAQLFKAKWSMFQDPGIQAFVNEVVRAIQTRANNQIVNSYVQGTCATIAKRSCLRIREELKRRGWGPRQARFMLPIHDELLHSVHRSLVVPFIDMAKGIMCNHPDVIKTLPLDASAAIGRTFEPWNLEKAPFGQIELNEAPPLEFLPKEVHGKRLNADQINQVVSYLMKETNNVRQAA